MLRAARRRSALVARDPHARPSRPSAMNHRDPRAELAERLRLWLPVALWAALIFVVSSIPSLSTGLGTWDLVLRKLAHLSEFAVLSALLLRAVGRHVPAFAVGLAYAVSDEVHQHFVRGRHAALRDVAVDAVGLALGFVVFRALRR
jgi:VanZ family protein